MAQGQIRIQRPITTRPREPQPIDLRSPLGRKLPY